MKTLTLTSPPMKGKSVLAAQRLLREHDFYHGAMDSFFGQETSSACVSAKYSLGYAMRNIKPTYGDGLEAFLTSSRNPTMLMRRRARLRFLEKRVGEKAISVGRQYVGVKENPPNSNRVSFSEWYGIIGPWCAMFVSFCMVRAGSKAFVRGDRYAYCPNILSDANAGKNNLIRVHKLKVLSGDIVLLAWSDMSVPQHVGFLLTRPNANGDFTTLEGNTGSSNADGGEVMIRERNVKNVVAFVRAIK